jgi:hypothetical protein
MHRKRLTQKEKKVPIFKNPSMVRCRSSGLKPLEKQVQGNWFMMKFLKFAFKISSFSTPIFASMGEASMEASAKKKGRRGVHRDSSIFFLCL